MRKLAYFSSILSHIKFIITYHSFATQSTQAVGTYMRTSGPNRSERIRTQAKDSVNSREFAKMSNIKVSEICCSSFIVCCGLRIHSNYYQKEIINHPFTSSIEYFKMNSANVITVGVKVAFEHEIRRVSFTGNTFSALSNLVATLFSIEKETIVIKYKDDAGDLITMVLLLSKFFYCI
jgi:hypothetical protein